MSVQICHRDERKMGQVIDQMKILANNLDELRSEIDALKVNCLQKEEDGFLRQTGNIKNNILRKLKNYARKVTSVHSLQSERKSDNQEAYYPCTNSDGPMSSFLNYIFRFGKRGDLWQIPSGVKYLKDEGNQTDEKLEGHVENQGPELMQHKNAEDKISSKKYVNVGPHCSDISCELDSRVETPVSSTINLPPDLSTAQIEPPSRNMEKSSPKSINKQFTAASTQTSPLKLRRNRRVIKSQSKNPNLYFSKIKNAVITKKIIRNSDECIFPNCRNDYPCSKKKFYKQCPCDKRKKNNIENIDYGEIDEKFSLDKVVQRLKDISPTNDDAAQEEDSSSSVSVDLEVNISDSSNKIEEFSERRRPRTYVVRKMPQKRDQDNWSNHFEKSVIYVGPTSDLTLFSHSFPN